MPDATNDVLPFSYGAFSVVPAMPGGEPAPTQTHAWKDGQSLGFHDLLDTINPLQHIPIVSSIYRWLTGDQPGNVARIVGDGIYGGPIGLATGVAAVTLKEETGKDPGEMVMALITGSDTDTGKTVVADASSTPTAAAPEVSPSPSSSAATPDPAAAPLRVAQASTTAVAEQPAPPATSPFLSPPAIPLFKSKTAVAPSATTPNTTPAEQAFLAQNAYFQRATAGQRGGPSTGRQMAAPIPLQLTGQRVPGAILRPPTSVASAPEPTAASMPQNSPADVPQRMLEALDKYMQYQRPQRGSQVDLAP
jgi:hypothetical protein